MVSVEHSRHTCSPFLSGHASVWTLNLPAKTSPQNMKNEVLQVRGLSLDPSNYFSFPQQITGRWNVGEFREGELTVKETNTPWCAPRGDQGARPSSSSRLPASSQFLTRQRYRDVCGRVVILTIRRQLPRWSFFPCPVATATPLLQHLRVKAALFPSARPSTAAVKVKTNVDSQVC